MNHVLRAVDELVALNASFERVGPAPAVWNRFAVDLAKQGTCGQSAETRQKLARVAQGIGESNEDRAVAAPYGDLAYILKHADDTRESHEHCAQALGEIWRTEHPFRRGREGDPYDVLLPHVSDALAVAALDRARRLPKPPSGLLKYAHILDRIERKQSLQGYDLSGLYLAGVDLSDMRLVKSNMVFVNLTGAKIERVDMRGADLSHADLSDASLLDTDLDRAVLEGTNLSNAYLRNTFLTRANLNKAKLIDADLFRANLMNAELTGARLDGAVLANADLSGVNLAGASLTGADMSDVCLMGTTLTDTNLAGVTNWPEYPLPAGWRLTADRTVERA